MKKKFISTLLLGALVCASTSMVVSCKDYDDDINGLQSQIDDLSALKAVKTDVETAISNLKTQLEAKDAELTTLLATAQTEIDANKTSISTSQAAIEANRVALAAEVSRAVAEETALEARIKTAEDAIAAIQTVLDGKVSKSDYDATVKDIYAKIEAVQTDLGKALTDISTLKNGLSDETTARKAVAADLEQQKAALAGYVTRLATLEGQGIITASDIATLKSNVGTLTTKLQALQDQVNNLSTTLGIPQIKADIQTLSNEIDKLQTEINALNVLIKDSLRSLVFRPDFYYWGIEATRISLLNYFSYTVPTTTWNTTETRGYNETLTLTTPGKRTDHARYDSIAGFKVLNFVASYHLNPSNADLKDATVNVLSDDKAFTRSAACGLSVKSWNTTTEAGMLTVNMNISNPDLIKTVADNNAVTVFATQVKLNKVGAKDTTITSDYATLTKQTIKGLVMAHTYGDGVPATGVENTHCGACKLAGSDATHKNHLHLMATAAEAKTFLSQDTCNYNETLDLRKLVETHYTTVDGQHRLLDAATLAANGLVYKFELTGLFLGNNKTSESAHAAINDDGYTFRPQMPDVSGNQQAYGATQQRQEIGRTPLVRVELIEKESGKVLDYGYIRIKITEKVITPVVQDKFISYTGSGYTYNYNGECLETAKPWSYETKWIQTEYDLYSSLDLTREEFEANYSTTPEVDATYGDLKQYTYSNGKFTAATTRYGSVVNQNDASSEDGTLTSTLHWNMTAAQAKEYFVTKNMSEVNVAIKYASKDVTKHPDIFVLFKTGTPITITQTTPQGAAVWDGNKNANYWYSANGSSDTGFDEIHTNVIPVEDNVGGTATVFDNTFSDVFVGNQLLPNKLVNVVKDLTASSEYATGNLTLDLVFDATNENKEYQGIDGNTYVMHVANNGKTLQAKIKGSVTLQDVAKIIYKGLPQDVNHEAVEYQKSDYAFALLNYKDHKSLASDVITAIIGLQAQDKCGKPLPLTNNTFNVRFLRPLNVFDNAKTIEDASTNVQQTIQMQDLVSFTDWRDAWKGSNPSGQYYTYYGITGVTIDGVADGQVISQNSNVLTDQSQTAGTYVSLSKVNGAVDFTYYSANGGSLTYKNLSSTVETFKVIIPVKISYIWGYLTTKVTVTINRTHSNAKRN